MRHRVKRSSSFGRKPGPKKALLRGLVSSLVEHERIKTTLAKAKALRPLAEKALTRARRGDLHSRRILLAKYPNKQTVSKLTGVLSERFKERAGGYTRIVKLGFRPGDQAPKALIEFVDFQPPAALSKEEKEKQRAAPSAVAERKKAKRLSQKAGARRKKHLQKIQKASRRRNRP